MMDTLTQAVLLLSAHFGKSTPGEPRPLGPAEYGRLAQWLIEHELEPQDLLLNDLKAVLADWNDSRISVDRICFLLGRSAALALALEKWERAGLWVITRADPAYPPRLKRMLKREAPPVLIGCGNQSLLSTGGLAVVGSRDATTPELSLAAHLGTSAAHANLTVVSGGAAGIDETAMLATIEAGGNSVGVLANHLLRTTTSKKYRHGLIEDRLALITPFNPEAAFDVGNAMARNRYIYCLAEAAVVVATGDGTGGTWNGALLNLKEGWVPLWINRNLESTAGGAALVEKGGRWLPDGDFEVAELLTASETSLAQDVPHNAGPAPVTIRPTHASDRADFFDLFVEYAQQLTRSEPRTPAQLCAALDLQKSQVDVWLARAVDEGRLRKLTRPLRYAPADASSGQPSLFR
ncbi:MAG: DNA-protecting protein DprA [Chloroflexi bacterium]|nr:DNA-protecting protein DprA [Chloroflexota bacterium]